MNQREPWKLRWLVWCGGCLIVLAVAYPLSWGPAVLYCSQRGWLPLEVQHDLYRPLAKVLEDISLHGPMHQYLGWWIALEEQGAAWPIR